MRASLEEDHSKGPDNPRVHRPIPPRGGPRGVGRHHVQSLLHRIRILEDEVQRLQPAIQFTAEHVRQNFTHVKTACECQFGCIQICKHPEHGEFAVKVMSRSCHSKGKRCSARTSHCGAEPTKQDHQFIHDWSMRQLAIMACGDVAKGQRNHSRLLETKLTFGLLFA